MRESGPSLLPVLTTGREGWGRGLDCSLGSPFQRSPLLTAAGLQPLLPQIEGGALKGALQILPASRQIRQGRTS